MSEPGKIPTSSHTSAGLSSHLRPLPRGGGSRHSPIGHFGRVVEGVDLARSSLSANAALRREIVDAVYEHGLLVFRGQSHLGPADEVAFAELFTHQPDDDGGVSYTGGAGRQHRLPDHPSVALVGSYAVRDYFGLTASSPGVYDDWRPGQRAWHCDGLADTHPPPDLTTMRCVKATSRGGETLFASSVRAAELLPTESLVERFGIHPEDVRVRYKLFGEYEIAPEGTHLEAAAGAKGDGRDGDEVNLAGGTTVPLVIRERHTGKRSMVGTYHVASIASSRGGRSGSRPNGTTQRKHQQQQQQQQQQKKRLGFKEANAYLAEAWRPGLSGENVYAHVWEVGDLAAWSNRLVIHTATSTRAYEGEERLHTRIRMRSREEDAPVAWNAYEWARPRNCHR